MSEENKSKKNQPVKKESPKKEQRVYENKELRKSRKNPAYETSEPPTPKRKGR